MRQVRERSDAVLALAQAFRRHGFEGASLSTIQAETGLGRGSLYHFFPAGKTDMAAAVLGEVHQWFEANVYGPLRVDGDPGEQLATMFRDTVEYFASRERVCLFAAMVLGEERARFAGITRGYFVGWVDALETTLRRAGLRAPLPRDLAVDAVAGIQGALILSRAVADDALFRDSLGRIEARLVAAVRSGTAGR